MQPKYKKLMFYFLTAICFSFWSIPALASTTAPICADVTAGLVQEWAPYAALSRKAFTKATNDHYKIEYFIFAGRQQQLEGEIEFIASHRDKTKAYRIFAQAVSAAITSNDKHTVKLLLEKVEGLEQHLVRSSRMSPFQLVSWCNNIGMLKILLRNGVDMYAQTVDKYRYDALWESIVFQNLEVTRYLLNHGFDPCRNYWIKNSRGVYNNRYQVAKNSEALYAIVSRLKCKAFSKGAK